MAEYHQSQSDFIACCRQVHMPPGDRLSVLDYMLDAEFPGHKQRLAKKTSMRVMAIVKDMRRRGNIS